MNVNSQLVDKFAIAISSLCVAHCLIFPILAVLIPSFITLGLESESMHFWMIITVIPSSIYSLALGCKKHAKISVFLIGALGLSCLLLAFALGGSILGETGEKALTVIGAIIIAISHVKNFKLCQKADDCKCHH
ncbi:MerC domain-containing protein [Pseudocolwellia sp. HL-MZ7]|uniref:MerC domain-containing protein n=1 Tax=Pseudocolwellia sp. HL-MZ7 TaxID=3400627 RepID=UPI003CEE6D17